MSGIFYSANGQVGNLIENMSNEDYYLDGSLKVAGSIISNKFVNEAGEPIGLPKDVDVKGSLKVKDQTELGNTLIKGGLNVNGFITGSLINGSVLNVNRIQLGNLILSNTDNSLRIQNENGYIDIGTKNKDWGHIYTDRPKFGLNKDLVDVRGNSSNYVKYTADGGLNVNNFDITTKNNELIFNNKETNKISMTMHKDGSVSLINKNQPVAQTPVAQTPVAQTPVAQTPLAQTPVSQKKIKFFNIEDAVGIKQ
jgi:hypothetical protein